METNENLKDTEESKKEKSKEQKTENLLDEIDNEDEPLPPPEEENEARELNTAAIVGIAMIGFIILTLIVLVVSSFKNRTKKEKEAAELDKAGNKTEIEFKAPSVPKQEEPVIPDVDDKDEYYEEEHFELPPEFQLPAQPEPGVAPVSPVGTTTKKSDRPDTRNSKSTRKIEGLGGLSFPEVQNVNSTVANAMNGTYGYGNQKLSKEDFIAQQMLQTQKIQDQLYGSGNNPGTNSDYTKQGFFESGIGSGGKGNYLSPATLWDGTIISAALVTAINTDNPGVVIARVTENVYSSYDHSYLLIPEGSLLYATYNSSVSYGQNMVQVAWNLLIRPDNYRIPLGNMNGVTAQGASGYKGFVNNHPFETMKALGMIAVFSMIQTEITGQIDSQKNEYLKNTMTDVYSEASKLGNRMLDRALDIKPTIKIREGTEIKLITNTPLELPPVEIPEVTQKYIRTR